MVDGDGVVVRREKRRVGLSRRKDAASLGEFRDPGSFDA